MWRGLRGAPPQSSSHDTSSGSPPTQRQPPRIPSCPTACSAPSSPAPGSGAPCLVWLHPAPRQPRHFPTRGGEPEPPESPSGCGAELLFRGSRLPRPVLSPVPHLLTGGQGRVQTERGRGQLCQSTSGAHTLPAVPQEHGQWGLWGRNPTLAPFQPSLRFRGAPQEGGGGKRYWPLSRAGSQHPSWFRSSGINQEVL